MIRKYLRLWLSDSVVLAVRNAQTLSVHRCDGSGLIVSIVRIAARDADATNDNAMEDRMRGFAQVALLACMSVLTSAALAFDNGQYENVPADIRAWFKSVTAPNGVPCCDISDGHRTDYDV